MGVLRDLQQEQYAWIKHNFPNRKNYQPLLGVMEELGELTHAHLKHEQNIRTSEDHYLKKIDAVGDIVIFLTDYCTANNIDLEDAVTKTWNDVKKRDWIRFPKNGLTE